MCELEEDLIKRILLKNYFYFNFNERKRILDMCFDISSDDFNKFFDKKYNCLIKNFEEYLSNNKSIILGGFINFRIKNAIQKGENYEQLQNQYKMRAGGIYAGKWGAEANSHYPVHDF